MSTQFKRPVPNSERTLLLSGFMAGKMAHRMLTLPPDETRSLLTTLQDSVASALAMFSRAETSYEPSAQEGSGSHLSAEVQSSANSALSRLEHLSSDEELDSGTELLDEILQIAHSSLTYPTYIFFSDSGENETPDIDTHKFSWTNPREDVKFLTTKLYNGFGDSLADARITLYKGFTDLFLARKSIFSTPHESAGELLEIAIQTARRIWFTRLEQKLNRLYKKREGNMVKSFDELARVAPTLFEKKSARAGPSRSDLKDRTADSIRNKMVKSPGVLGRDTDLSKVTSSDWGESLKEEIVHHWLEKSLCTAGSVPTKILRADFQCSGSSVTVKEWDEGLFARNIKGYIGFEVESSNVVKPVRIRMLKERDDDFLLGHPSKDTCVMVAAGGKEGIWISISDADEPEKPKPEVRRILICQSNEFHSALSAFLRTPDINEFKELEGYKWVDNANSESEPLDLPTSGAQA